MLRRRLPLLFAIASMCFARAIPTLALPSESQSASSAATFEGLVLDPARAPVAGAAITATSHDLSLKTEAVSDQRGRFSIALPPGRYALAIASEGFATFEQTIDIGAARGVREFVLSIPALEETVDVAAPAPGYREPIVSSSTRTPTLLRDVPQSVSVVTKELMRDQLMVSLADVVRYMPGITAHQGENNRDQVVIRGNSSSSDFFLDGVRDDAQYYRDLYNLDRVEALKGPNAMIFGRGGGGGVINRVPKEAGFTSESSVTLMAGAFGDKRIAADLDRAVSPRVAVRLNAVYEDADSFRDGVTLDRYGINPTATFLAGSHTRLTIGYEHFHDRRVADRGIPSFQGRPVDVDISTYFGNPSASAVRARVDTASAHLTHQAGAMTIQNRTLLGSYSRAYQNFVPGTVTPDKTQVSLSAYNNSADRLNVFNQTDVSVAAASGPLRHTLLAGVEVGRQRTDNFRNTGYFDDTATSMLIPYDRPGITTPVIFRQSATDADNAVRATVAAAYVQDQIALPRLVQLIGGLRFDAFDLSYHNNRTGDDRRRLDRLVSPRAGIVVKPLEPLSFYGSYSVSFLPSSGDQFSSLTAITEQMKPEKFINYEAGAKWDVRPDLAVTTAVYQLDRTNTRSTDPVDPTRIVQTGSQRTVGYELGINGRLAPAWQVAGGYAFQHASVTSATASARAGAIVPQVPRHALSLWNLYQATRRVGVGLGLVHRTDMFAAIDNTVVLPGYLDVDAAIYASLTRLMRLQVNVENLFDGTHYVNADNNTNISPGSPRAIRVSLVVPF